jgi:FMN phosphatase YigB (HAD superfamily)
VYCFIFDIDGTLYQFDKGAKNISGSTRSYEESDFKKDLHNKVRSLFQNQLGYSDSDWMVLEREMNEAGNPRYSRVAQDHGVKRKDYFDYVWDLDPSKYVLPNGNLKCILEATKINFVISNAPTIWVSRVLRVLGVEEYFNSGNLFTGELEICKPSPDVFGMAVEYLKAEPSKCYSIGDQEETDLIPAQSLGMKTVLVGNKREKCRPTHEIDSIDGLLEKLPPQN